MKSPSINTVLGLFKFDSSLFLERIGSLEQELALNRLSDNTNPVIWIAGHLTSSRSHLLGLLGTKIELPWGEVFDKQYDPSTKYPAISAIKDAWVDISDQLFEKLGRVSDGELSKKIDLALPHGDNTIRGAIIFFSYHESWHFGQISYIRRCNDMEGLVPY